MSKFKIYLEYDGTRYSGWQKQNNAKTIQGSVIKALSEIFGNDKFDFQGSGRTDSGVHALCQVAHLEAKTMLAPEILKLKINDILPHDINILEIKKAAPDFHARHDAISRSYIYQISRRRTAFGKNYVWWIKDKLNFKAMDDASKLFKGMHDFSSFAEEDKEDKSKKVLVEDIQLKEIGDLILIHVQGSHFIWKMVRRVTGILVEVGRNRKSIHDVDYYLNNLSNEPAKFTAPPSGLYLAKVLYNGDKQEDIIEPMLKISKHRQ